MIAASLSNHDRVHHHTCTGHQPLLGFPLSASIIRKPVQPPCGPSDPPPHPPPGERCGAPSACKINHRNSVQTMRPLTWQFLPECILISTRRAKKGKEKRKKKKDMKGEGNYLQKSSVCAICWMPFCRSHPSALPTKSLGARQRYINVAA